jgi:hypothetical protein
MPEPDLLFIYKTVKLPGGYRTKHHHLIKLKKDSITGYRVQPPFLAAIFQSYQDNACSPGRDSARLLSMDKSSRIDAGLAPPSLTQFP